MDYIEVIVRTATEGADLVSDILVGAGATGTSIEDRQDILLMPQVPGMWDAVDDSVLAKMDEDVLVRAYFRADGPVAERLVLVQERLARIREDAYGLDLGPLTLTTNTVHDQDWAETWKQYYKPFRPGERLVIKPSWEEYTAGPGELILEIDPGMAFGTGTHETTLMCLLALEAWVRPGQSVIDVGCGTGILAIAAARLGAGDVLAIDLDPDAVLVAFENVKKNGVEETVRVVAGDLLKQRQERADLVVANIIADAIIALAGPVTGHLKPGGTFICSGIIRDRAADVEAALDRAGYVIQNRYERGEWVCYAATQEERP